MPNRLGLIHLTYVGSGRDPVGLELGPKLTVITGPSDTGKSFILDSIDFMLGAKSLREIDELEGYSHVLLGISVLNEEIATFTLMRPVTGGKTHLYEGDVRNLPNSQAARVLNESHNAENVRNLSNFLLTEIDLSNQRVRKNARNTTRSLSFRDVAHLCVISETNIQAVRSPVFSSGNPQNETVEKSILKLFLEGEDDAGLIEVASDAEVKISRGKNAMLDKVIAELTKELETLHPDALPQLKRLEASIRAESSSIEQTVAIRDGVWSRRRSLTVELAKNEDRIMELEELIARFALLSTQYESDLSRLEMVREGGTLLNLFEPDVCILSGAWKEHQHHETIDVLGVEHLQDAVTAEADKTEALYADLRSTIAAMMEEKNALQLKLENIQQNVQAANREIARLDQALEPTRSGLLQLTAAKTKIERSLVVQEQISRVEQLRGSIELVEPWRRV